MRRLPVWDQVLMRLHRKWLFSVAGLVLLGLLAYFVIDYVGWKIFEADMLRRGGSRIP